MLSDAVKVNRLTSLWALSEAALGGVLHAFQVPFTGLYINGASVLFLSLIAFYGSGYRTVLKATMLVLIIKATVSPHTPINAYFAVTVQGILASFLIRPGKSFKVGGMILGMLTLMQSAVQRIIVLTIIFGMNLWDSIDIFGNYVVGQFDRVTAAFEGVSYSFLLISIYIGIHVLFGIIVGFYASRIPHAVELEVQENPMIDLQIQKEISNQITHRNKKRKWLKPINALILFLALGIVVLTYIFPAFTASEGKEAIVMIIRSVVIMLVWYTALGPLVRKLYFNYLKGKKARYSGEIEQSLLLMPVLRRLISSSWNQTKNLRGLARFKRFSIITLVLLFTLELPNEA